MKLMSPDTLAKGLISKQGPNVAAQIARREARPFIGVRKDQANPNLNYFTNVMKYILKRHPTALDK